MKKVKFICEQYVDMLGILIAVLTVFSSFFITGLFGMGKYGTLINYTLCTPPVSKSCNNICSFTAFGKFACPTPIIGL